MMRRSMVLRNEEMEEEEEETREGLVGVTRRI